MRSGEPTSPATVFPEQAVSRWDPVFLVLLALAAALPFLGSFGLLEPDEGRYGQTGREMVQAGDPWTPRFNGVEQFIKPPMTYWFAWPGYSLGGISEWTARLPSAFSFGASIVLVGWMGWVIGGRMRGWIAALLFASMAEPYALGRQILMDPILSFWTTASLACLVGVAMKRHPDLLRWLFFLCLGSGFLAKGPMAWVVPGSAAVFWTFFSKKDPQAKRLPWLFGVPVAVAVGLSWFFFQALKYPPLWSYFLGYELVDRFGSTIHGRHKPWWFFLPVLAVGALPWSGFLVSLGKEAGRKIWSGEASNLGRALAFGFLFSFAVVSLSGSKLLTYILPLFPLVALGISWLLCQGGSSAFGWWVTRGFFLAYGPALWSLRFFWEDARLATPHPLYLGLVTLAGWAYVVWSLRPNAQRPRAKPAVIGALLCLCFWHGASLQMSRINDLLGRQASVRSLGEMAKASGASRFFIYRAHAGGFLFVLNQPVWFHLADAFIQIPPSKEAADRIFDRPEELFRGLERGEKVVGITLRHNFAKSFDSSRWSILGRAGQFYLVEATAP